MTRRCISGINTCDNRGDWTGMLPSEHLTGSGQAWSNCAVAMGQTIVFVGPFVCLIVISVVFPSGISTSSFLDQENTLRLEFKHTISTILHIKNKFDLHLIICTREKSTVIVLVYSVCLISIQKYCSNLRFDVLKSCTRSKIGLSSRCLDYGEYSI